MDDLPHPTWRPVPGTPATDPLGGEDRYLPTDRLGEGGMAEVWRAWDRKLGAWCALKVLRRKYAEQREARRRFMDEGRILIQLDHRNVIHAYDLLDVDPPQLVMEVADGGSLYDWVARHGRMPPRMAVGIAIQICKGLGAAHRQNVIHRDVNPRNVLVNRKGVCKVSDFGIARIPRRDGTHDVPDATTVSHTGNDNAMGTLGYMAPEQRSNPKGADFRTDIYGVGAALYHLLVGGPNPYLFAAEQNPEVLREIPAPLRPVLLRTIAYRPEDRFDEIGKLSRALYYVRDELPEDPPDTPQLAEGLPPEPPPPPGMTAGQAGLDRPDETDIEVPTTIRRPSAPGRATSPRSSPRPAADRTRSSSPRPASPVPAPAPSPAPPPPLPPSLQSTPSRASTLSSRPYGTSRIEDRLSRPAAQSTVSVDLRRPALIAGTRLWVVALAMVGFLLSGILASHVYLRTYQNRSLSARYGFLSQVHHSRKSLGDLLNDVPGVDSAAVHDGFDDLLRAQRLQDQIRASRELRQALEQVRPQLGGCDMCPQAQRHIDSLVQEQNEWREAHRAWVEVSDGLVGRLAIGLGLNPDPPRYLP